MGARIQYLPRLISFCALAFFGTSVVLAQHSIGEFQKILGEKAPVETIDFAAVEQGQTFVSLLPAKDKREVAVCGLVSLQVPSELFLRSFRDSMSRKTNAAILEIGRFNSTPTLQDLQGLTIEDRDLDDMKECVVGDCNLKLSAAMIQRFKSEIDQEATDYHPRATLLLKQMLVEYVRDYLARGDAALIHYNDKSREIRMAEEQRGLVAASTYVNLLPEFPLTAKGLSDAKISLVEDAIVWSKIKFGLKPVFAINHITIYRRDQETGPQVLVLSKQIYANHYFDSSLALTALVNLPNAGTYLYYENRSRADGLEGMFSKFKRGIIENRAIDSLKTILETSKANLTAQSLNATEPTAPSHVKRSWGGWKMRGVLFMSLLLITAFVAFLTFGNYSWRGGINGRMQH